MGKVKLIQHRSIRAFKGAYNHSRIAVDRGDIRGWINATADLDKFHMNIFRTL